jgi:hypothetical protein
VAVTKAQAREVNIEFGETFTFDATVGDRIFFVVKDVGFFAENHIGGLGPKNVAKGSLAIDVGTFEG